MDTFTMDDDHMLLAFHEPVPHAGHDARDQGKRWGMMIGPGIMPYPVVDILVRIARAFGAKLPNGPVVLVFGVEEFD